jgi:bifunctional N-acetylglucosamine-1-phosphate-uridyltransferase/glucosamine-1-phosphate-acetyltransferase GlmU-like protein
MSNISVLIAAGGMGSRSGLEYPKTLYVVNGKPILHRLHSLFHNYDQCPKIIVSPKGKSPIKEFLRLNSLDAELIIQKDPKGMGDAVLQSRQSINISNNCEHIILSWSDIPFLSKNTLNFLVKNHLESQNDFSFITADAIKPYTFVERNSDNELCRVIETREMSKEVAIPSYGERDIGLFMFKKNIVFNTLLSNSKNKFGKVTGEHGFLYVIEEILKLGGKVNGYKIAKKQELLSFNTADDLKQIQSFTDK